MVKDIFVSNKGYYCEINQKYYPSIRGLLNYIRTQSITSEEYYLKFLGEKGSCKTCGNPTNFHQINTGYKTYCSNKCAKNDDKQKQIISNRFVGNPEKLHNSLKKRSETLSKKSKNEMKITQDKRVSTLKERYGDDYFSRKTKLQWKRRSKQEIDLIVSKSNLTKRKNNTFSEPYKNTNKKVTINGKLFKVQGYEDIALNLLSEIVDINQIKIGKDVPKILLSTGNYYYPDILIEDLIIEVKSEYTYEVALEKNILKHNETIKAGYNHVFLVINSRDLNKNRTLKNKEKYLNMLHKIISSQVSKEKGSTTIPSLGVGVSTPKSGDT